MKTQVTITLDQDVKNDLQKFAAEIGTNMSTLLNLSAKHLTLTRRINFDFSTMMTPSIYNSHKQALVDLKNRKDMIPISDL